VPHLDHEGELQAEFLAPGDPADAIEVKGIRRDVAWVQYESEGELDGTTGKVPYERIRPRDES
jgi:hypothetical protein